MWLIFLKDHWRSLAVLVAMVACFGGGAYLGRQSVEPQIQVQEKIVEKEKIVTVEVDKRHETKDATTVTVTKPDGATTTTTTEHTETKEEKSASTKKDTSKTDDTRPAVEPDKYRVGAFAARSLPSIIADPFAMPNWGVAAGMRVLGPAWVDGSYNFGNKDITLGLSVQF